MIELRSKQHARVSLIAMGMILAVASLFGSLNLGARAENFPEYQRYVHDYLNSGVLGNWTYMEKPMFPILFNDSQILIGENWSIVCPLVANHSYHVYCYGEWVNKSSEPKTDYDIYVYNPSGELEGYHTESAGLPEHLGSSVEKAFFAPKYSGNYTFVMVNDQRESKGAQQATFMIIENVECDVWREHYIEGKDEYSQPIFNTSWAFEFMTESQYIEVWVKVPESLDMYEARLYLMTDPKQANKTVLNGVPLAWETGLFGERNGTVGGYNLESKEYRGVAYASCELHGQDMFLNYTLPYSGKNLYHLVFVGEIGAGSIEFLVKTEFGNVCLKPSSVPSRVYPYNETAIAYASSSTNLVSATINYTVDGWRNMTVLEMEIVDNSTCIAVIPGQVAGTLVSYRVEALDALVNVLVVNGSYSVKHHSALNISLVQEKVYLGESMTVRGHLIPETKDVPITVHFESANETIELMCRTSENGTFMIAFQPNATGMWGVQARFAGDSYAYENLSPQLMAKVEEAPLYVKYAPYIGGVGIIAVIGIVIYLKKSKG
ncbi:MAG: hypothetical protein OEZ40_10605 [Candidatus Bathyarchaeota archaeon]|nr:hypothetical protein [Candidatus Bathyarchaeota archaeon]